MSRVEKFEEFHLDLLPTIDSPPFAAKNLHKQACTADDITVETWRTTWLSHYKTNQERFGPFRDHSIAKIHNKFWQRPCIVAGNGASLARNAEHLVDRKGIPFISPLHNYAFLYDKGIEPEFYCTLDAGKIVIPDMTEGKSNGRDDQYYWDSTEGKTLLAYCSTDPEVLAKWKGEILFFNAVVPAMDIIAEQDKIEIFRHYISTGGNVTGASTYIAKVILGCNPVIWVGCNYAMSYDRRFGPWKDPKFKMGNVVRAIDIYGNSVPTYPSYLNFKYFLEWLSLTIPGLYINSSEEGCLGAFPDGNLRSIMQLPLKYVLEMYSMSNEVTIQLPEGKGLKVEMKDILADPEYLIPELKRPFCMY